jgi:putative endonuclease
MAYMYILRCSDDSFYVGSTVDLEVRLAQHSDGAGGEYTRRRLPVTLVYSEEFDRVDEAFAREKQVQGWGRAKRIALITGALGSLPPLSRRAR